MKETAWERQQNYQVLNVCSKHCRTEFKMINQSIAQDTCRVLCNCTCVFGKLEQDVALHQQIPASHGDTVGGPDFTDELYPRNEEARQRS